MTRSLVCQEPTPVVLKSQGKDALKRRHSGMSGADRLEIGGAAQIPPSPIIRCLGAGARSGLTWLGRVCHGNHKR